MTVADLVVVLQSMEQTLPIYIEDESNYLDDNDNTEGLFAQIYLQRPNATTWLDGTQIEE
jgi:hypothetical protein